MKVSHKREDHFAEGVKYSGIQHCPPLVWEITFQGLGFRVWRSWFGAQGLGPAFEHGLEGFD